MRFIGSEPVSHLTRLTLIAPEATNAKMCSCARKTACCLLCHPFCVCVWLPLVLVGIVVGGALVYFWAQDDGFVTRALFH